MTEFDEYDCLVGCEESGIVRDAMSLVGVRAISCDLVPTRRAGPHYQGDVMDALRGRSNPWPLAILHPDCTCLTVSGNRTYAQGKPGWPLRVQAVAWTRRLWQTLTEHAERGCLENPKGVLSTMGGLGGPQYIQPHQFGHGEVKETGLWLWKLPPLIPTRMVCGREPRIWKMGPSETRKRDRSVTYPGIAAAFAEQWGRYALRAEDTA